MKYIEKYLERVLKIKPLGTITTERDVLNKELSGERIYVDGVDTGIFVAHVDYISWVENNCVLISKGRQNVQLESQPKFKVGDWIIGRNYTKFYKIIEVYNTWYDVIDNDGFPASIPFDNEKDFRLWTIQDAKSGDVLAYENDIVIFKENNYNSEDKSGCMFVCCLIKDNGDEHWYEIGGINPIYYHPATKEQCDLLFLKMKKAGYKLDENFNVIKI